MISLALALAAQSAVALPPVPPLIDVAACEDPARRSDILAKDGDIQRLFAESGAAMTEFNRQKEVEMDQQLAQLDLPSEERAEFSAALLQHPRFVAAMAESNALIEQIMAEMTALTQTTDERASCRAVARMSALAPQIVAKTDAQWRIMAELVAAEGAKRRAS